VKNPLKAHLALAAALRTRRRRRTRSGAGSIARLAVFLARNLDDRFGAPGRFLERDFQVVAEIGATLRSASSASAAAEQIAEAEDVAEPAEDVFEAVEDRRVEASAGAGAGDAGVAEAVVEGALLAVGEDGVRFGGLLELLLGGLVARIAIRVVFHRQLAIRALDLAVGRAPRYAEDFVVVETAHDAFATLTIAGRSSRSPMV
jgi:hypothetical protein